MNCNYPLRLIHTGFTTEMQWLLCSLATAENAVHVHQFGSFYPSGFFTQEKYLPVARTTKNVVYKNLL